MSAIAFLLLVGISTCNGLITQQQLGAVDWHRQFVGRVTHAVFAPANRPRVYITSEAGALAALNLRNGSLLWRQVCPHPCPSRPTCATQMLDDAFNIPASCHSCYAVAIVIPSAALSQAMKYPSCLVMDYVGNGRRGGGGGVGGMVPGICMRCTQKAVVPRVSTSQESCTANRKESIHPTPDECPEPSPAYVHRSSQRATTWTLSCTYNRHPQLW